MRRSTRAGIPGEMFKVPLEDGSARVAQVLAIHWDAFQEPICAFTLVTHEDWTIGAGITLDDVMAVQTVTSDLLRTRPQVWKVFDSRPPLFVSEDVLTAPERRWLQDPHTRTLVPSTNPMVIGSGLMTDFLEACLGLRPWDEYAWPEYNDGVLLPGRARPAAAYMGDRHRGTCA